MSDRNIPKSLPHDPEAETAILSIIMDDPVTMLEKAQAELPEGSFHDRTNELVYKTMRSMHGEERPIEYLTITPYMRERGTLDAVGGAVRLSEIFNATLCNRHFGYFAAKLRTAHAWRRFVRMCEDGLNASDRPTDDLPILVSKFSEALKEIANAGTTGRRGAVADFTPYLLSADKLCALDIPQRTPLLGPFMKEGDFGYVFAPRGAGKSWLCSMMGNSISEGIGLGEWQAGESARPVYYFDAEMNLPDVKDRAEKVGITSKNFHWLSNEYLAQHGIPGINIASPSHQAALSAMLPDGAVFIIDNLSTSQSGMRENENDDFDVVRDWLLGLRHRRVTVLLIHHAGRNGAMRGGSRREDTAHWIISLKDGGEGSGQEKTFITSFSKVRNCPAKEAPPLKWTLKDSSGQVTLTCEKHNGPDALLGHIRDGVGSATELAGLLDVQPGTVSKWAKLLIEQRLIEKVGREYNALETSPF